MPAIGLQRGRFLEAYFFSPVIGWLLTAPLFAEATESVVAARRDFHCLVKGQSISLNLFCLLLGQFVDIPPHDKAARRVSSEAVPVKCGRAFCGQDTFKWAPVSVISKIRQVIKTWPPEKTITPTLCMLNC